MLRTYFSVLFEEFKVVRADHGIGRAAFSTAFLIDAVPGLVMSILFGQMQLLAAPLKLALGEDYSAENLRTQVESIFVTFDPRTNVDWQSMDEGVSAVDVIVPGLVKLSVPSLFPFTRALMNVAQKAPAHARALRISDNEVVQIRVAVDSSAHILRLRELEGVAVKFDFQLPTDGKAPGTGSKTIVSVGVEVVSLFAAIRSLVALDGVEITQVYDFWA
jgi:hypothetical protein